MALIPMEYDGGGWTSTTLTPRNTAVNSYGTLTAFRNKELHLVQLIWRGNNNIPTIGEYLFDYPSSDYKPITNTLSVVRNGDYVEVSQSYVSLRLTDKNWSAGSVMYVTN